MVRGIIINHIDGSYHDEILNQQMQNPLLIIQHLKEVKDLETRETPSSLKKKIHVMKLVSDEYISEFIKKFDNNIRRYVNSLSLTKWQPKISEKLFIMLSYKRGPS